MTEDQKTPPGPMWLALLSAAIVLGTGPAALAFLVLLGSGREDGGLESLARLVTEGGGASYAVLFGGALASLLGAVLTGISVRRPGLPAPLALLPFLLPVLAALGGVIFGMRGVLAAIASVAPADKATIMMAASAELTSLCIQALAFAASGALAVALAALVSLAAPARGGRVVTLLGAGTLGLSLGVMAAQDFSMRSGFSALASVSPMDRLTLLAGIIEEWQQLNRVAHGLFLVSLLVAVVGAVVLARSQRAAGLGVGATLLVAAVGLRGFNAMTERQLFTATHASARPTLMAVNGCAPMNFDFVTLSDEEPARVDEAVLRRTPRGEVEHPWVAVELRPQLEAQTVLRALQTAHFVRANVELIGDGPKKQLEAPPLFAAAVAVVSDVRLSAPVRVLFESEPCDGCSKATLSDAGLTVGGLEWRQDEVPRFGELDGFPGVELAWPNDTSALVRAALIALSHRHLLVVRVPPPEPPPVLPDY